MRLPAALLVLLVLPGYAAAAPPGSRTTTTPVSGTWSLTGDLTRGVAVWTGDLAGASVLRGTATTDAHGTTRGRFTEVLDVVRAEGRAGTLTFDVTYELAETLTATARVVDSSCGFERSGGTLVLRGSATQGTWTGQWVHPTGPSVDRCVPDLPRP